MSSSVKPTKEELLLERFKLLLGIERESRISQNLDLELKELKQKKEEIESLLTGYSYTVTGYPETTTKEDLERYLSKFGELKGVHIMSKPVNATRVAFNVLNNEKTFVRQYHAINNHRLKIAANKDDGEKTILVSGKQAKFVSINFISPLKNIFRGNLTSSAS
jgi:hypothetical protein